MVPDAGTIAEREHRKWENAVAMPNNPYTLERVRQRRRSRPLDRTGYYASHHRYGRVWGGGGILWGRGSGGDGMGWEGNDGKMR